MISLNKRSVLTAVGFGILLAGLIAWQFYSSPLTASTIQMHEPPIESWERLVVSKTQGFFVGRVVDVGNDVVVNHQLDGNDNKWQWTPYTFEIERVIDPTNRQETENQTITIYTLSDEMGVPESEKSRISYLQPGDNIALALQWAPNGKIQPEGYSIWAAYDVNNGQVTGGEDAVQVENLPLEQLSERITKAVERAN